MAQDGCNCRFSIADCRPPIADRHWKELAHHFSNRQTPISPPRLANENLVFPMWLCSALLHPVKQPLICHPNPSSRENPISTLNVWASTFLRVNVLTEQPSRCQRVAIHMQTATVEEINAPCGTFPCAAFLNTSVKRRTTLNSNDLQPTSYIKIN